MAYNTMHFRSLVFMMFLVGFCTVFVHGEAEKLLTSSELASLSLEKIEEELQSCSIVQQLSSAKAAGMDNAQSGFMKTAFAYLFPGSPAVNSLLATLYISGPPNFLLALCPPNIDPASLTIMVAFAVGGLMGDTLFHLLPEIFLGEDESDKARLVLVEPNRNLLLGVMILVGFMTFVAMDKGLRIATGGEGHSHDHGHSYSHESSKKNSKSTAVSSAIETTGTLKNRKGLTIDQYEPEPVTTTTSPDGNPSVKLASYLNLIADFTHNITDGLAMSASFYASPTIGASTMLAVFLHEIPHEVGDFALLIQSGFSKRQAMGAQFVTAIGAFLGTGIGIGVQEMGGGGGSGGDVKAGMSRDGGIWGTSLAVGDLILPFTAGTFLYVGTVSVIPELLETGPDRKAEVKKTLGQFLAVAVGAGIMLYISWQ